MSSSPMPPVRVLHLEDSPRDADIIGHKLTVENVSCEIEVADCRERFEAALARGSFDVILCDYNLPGYDGVSALKQAKAVQPDAPVIIISGTVGEEEAVRCLRAGATDYLLKGRLERLAPAVRRAIQEAEERRRRTGAEAELSERERWLSSIYQAVADMLFYVEVEADGGYRVISVNPAFLETTGLEYDQVVGKRLEDVLPTPGIALEHLAQAIRERRVVRWEDTSVFPKRRLTGALSASPVFNAAGACTHLVGAIHDITDRRYLEAQLRQAQKMESVGRLAGGIAHDFNNLLTIINGMAEFALAQITDGDRQLQEDLEEIRQAGERAATLTRQLLAFSRKQILKPQVIDLNAAIAEMSNMLRRLLGEDIDLVVTTSAAAHASVKADRGQIEQVIANLVVNARDAMPYGGTLSIHTSSVVLDEQFGRQLGAVIVSGPYVALDVDDTGSGMDDLTRRQVFEPFFTTKEPGKGTGLGLSTVYGIVKQSGGYITVDSEVGRGSCFTIYLPQVAETVGRQAGAPSLAPVYGTETILVVEDVNGLRRLISRTLESAGYKVLTAASGEEALQVLDEYCAPVHVAVTDVVMHGMSGRTLAEHLDRLRPDMKIIYMSGYTDDVILRHGVLNKGVPFVSKPFRMSDLSLTIRQILDARDPTDHTEPLTEKARPFGNGS
jgi:two-component system, cell cycle sensor histidine kinase and response regulator CckA